MTSKLPLPFWKRTIQRYPYYWKGNPQLRICLPRFWMKMVKPDYDMPKDYVQFVTHHQMSKADIKQYLEKIYKVPVLSVRTEMRSQIQERHPATNYTLPPEQDRKVAYVQLADGQTFEFPDSFKDKQTHTEKNVKDYQTAAKGYKELKANQYERLDLPPWFRQ